MMKVFVVSTLLIILNIMIIQVFSFNKRVSQLEQIPLKSKQISISGMSSGAMAAAQFYLSHSKISRGVVLFSGMLYRCGHIVWIWLVIKCLQGFNDLDEVLEMTNDFERNGLIDPTNKLSRNYHYIHHGRNDMLINPRAADKNAEFFENFSNNVWLRKSESQHAIPTQHCGKGCHIYNYSGCSKCGFSGVHEGLNYIYQGGFRNPFDELNGCTQDLQDYGMSFEYIDQSEFTIPFGSSASMYELGLLYTPPQCWRNSSNCNLHVDFHGCRGSIEDFLEAYNMIKCSGWVEIARANNLIVLFPQISFSKWDPFASLFCWDFHGYTGPYFGTKLGSQIQVVYRMVSRILGIQMDF